MKKILMLLIAILISLSSFAQTTQTRCTDVVYASLYVWSESQGTFVHDNTQRSTLNFCMSENHLQVDNQAGTYIIITKNLGKYERPGHTEMSFRGTDKDGNDYTIVYIFKDHAQYYMRMQVVIHDWSKKLRVEYYLNPF